ncbi:GNAT family N-acetyltransferase [Novosphingobium sp.]|uniref:GNAT family N-acetyltransferase n=1 Tax=Novosphingobium sp. TaxID=1874826 RepID=UPI00273316E7|nr:GNAT family N-acetyltransferase [Novosphingobium sp.]MDP3907772.1 GNAT family N-acetyltransferase [Novosphingobium sp.]
MDTPIITLDETHRAAAVATLAAAFQNDPAVSWIIPDPAARARRLRLMYDWLFSDHLAHGLILGTPDVAAVTLWREPGKVHLRSRLTPPHVLHLLRIFGPCIMRAAKVGDSIDAHLLRGEGRYYLRYAGVRPDCQGKGLGGRTIRAGLARAAQAGVPAVLETATASNVGLYQRLGFVIREEWDVPGREGPHFWTMEHPDPA